MLVQIIEDLSDILVRYDYTAKLSRGNWAWEFARRNQFLRAEAFASQSVIDRYTDERDIQCLKLEDPNRPAESWGLLFFPDPDQSAVKTNVFWSDDAYARKITISVRDREPGEVDDIYDKCTRLCRIIHLRDAFDREHLLVKGNACSIQVKCTGKSLLRNKPIKMEFAIPEFSNFQEHARALDRAQKVFSDNDNTPPTWSRKTLGYRNALIALDARHAGLSYRDTATIFYGEERVANDWSGASRAIKSEMARLVAKGLQLRDGGYRRLLEEDL